MDPTKMRLDHQIGPQHGATSILNANHYTDNRLIYKKNTINYIICKESSAGEFQRRRTYCYHFGTTQMGG